MRQYCIILIAFFCTNQTILSQDWEIQESNVNVDLNDVCFIDENYGWAVGNSATTIATTDGGRTWVRQFGLDTTIVFKKVEFIDSKIGFVGGNRITELPFRASNQIILLHTTDGGNHWEEYDLGFGSDFGFRDLDFIDANKGWVVVNNYGGSSPSDKQGILLTTQNSGQDWTVLVEKKLEVIGAIGFWNEHYGYSFWLRGFDNFGHTDVYHSINGGEQWESVGRIEVDHIRKVEFLSQDTLWALGSRVAKSEDGGMNWIPWRESFVLEDERRFFPSDINIFDSNCIWLAGVFSSGPYNVAGALISTQDSGDSWDLELKIEDTAFLGLSVVSTNHAWMVGRKGLILHGNHSTAVTNEEIMTIPKSFQIHQPYPNPFNPTTTIKFSISQSGIVTLSVYDVLGREVETILNQHKDAGYHIVQWNASDVPSGIYFVTMVSGEFRQTRKVMVLK